MKNRQGPQNGHPTGHRQPPEGGLPNLSGRVDDGTTGDRIVGRSDIKQDKTGGDRKHGDRGRTGGGPEIDDAAGQDFAVGGHRKGGDAPKAGGTRGDRGIGGDRGRG